MSSSWAASIRQSGGFPVRRPETLQVRAADVCPLDMLDTGEFVRAVRVNQQVSHPGSIALTVGVLQVQIQSDGSRVPLWTDERVLGLTPIDRVNVTRGLTGPLPVGMDWGKTARPPGEAAAEARERHARLVDRLGRFLP